MKRLYLVLVLGLLVLTTNRLIAQSSDECPPPLLGEDTPNYAYYVGIGDTYNARQQFSSALIAYTCAIDVQADYAPAYARRGFAYTALGDSDAALADFNRALELDETLLEAYINRGVFYTRAANYALAIGDFTLVLSLSPTNSTALQNRAVVHAIEGNFELALADLNAAIEIAPEDPNPYAARAAIYSVFALQDYQQFLKVSGNTRAPLPAGSPSEVLGAVDENLRSGSVAVWLALLRDGQ